MTNICKSIQCPYFADDHKTSWGCQRYSVAPLCHLIGNPDKGNYRKELKQTSTQYALHGDGYDVAVLKQENEKFLASDPRYLDDKFAKESDFLGLDQAPFRLIDKTAIGSGATAVKKISELKPGDKFWFNNGLRGEQWVLDEIKKDERFPNERDPHEVWEIAYHLDIPSSRQAYRHIDERDTAIVII